MDVISAYNPWSCGLACLESVARSQGRDLDQGAYIREHATRFPAWKEMPGVLALNISWVGRLWMVRWELYDIARQLELATQLGMLRDPEALLRHLALSESSVIAVTKRHREGGVMNPKNHAVRLIACDGEGVTLMNPGRDLPGRLEKIVWEDFMAWEPFVFALSKPHSAAPGSEAPLIEPQDFKV